MFRTLKKLSFKHHTKSQEGTLIKNDQKKAEVSFERALKFYYGEENGLTMARQHFFKALNHYIACDTTEVQNKVLQCYYFLLRIFMVETYSTLESNKNITRFVTESKEIKATFNQVLDHYNAHEKSSECTLTMASCYIAFGQFYYSRQNNPLKAKEQFSTAEQLAIIVEDCDEKNRVLAEVRFELAKILHGERKLSETLEMLAMAAADLKAIVAVKQQDIDLTFTINTLFEQINREVGLTKEILNKISRNKAVWTHLYKVLHDETQQLKQVVQDRLEESNEIQSLISAATTSSSNKSSPTTSTQFETDSPTATSTDSPTNTSSTASLPRSLSFFNEGSQLLANSKGASPESTDDENITRLALSRSS